MNIVTNFILSKFVLLVSLLLLLSGCHDLEGQPWRITVGLDKPKEMVFVDGEYSKEVRICLNTMGGSGYPTRVSARFDDEKYTPMLVGQCMYFTGKRVSVKFANPSSGKYATGTYTLVSK